jgi:electron transport complex protein RnfA
MNIAHFAQISIGAILFNNIVLSRFLGLCPFFGVSRKLPHAIGMGVAVTIVMVLGSFLTWPMQHFILIPSKTTYLQTIVFILIIGGLVQCLEMIAMKYFPAMHEAVGIYLPLITTNCAVLGIAVINAGENILTGQSYTFAESMVNSIASGIGFTLAMALMAGVREKLDLIDIPKPLEGLPIALIVAGLMALGFSGFSGFTR